METTGNRATGHPGFLFFDDEFGPELRNQIIRPNTEVARQPTANGGEIWTLNFISDGTSAEQRFYVHPDGYLASWSWRALGVHTDLADQTMPIDAGEVSYTLLDDPDPLRAPEVGAPLDTRALDLPEDFRISE